MTKSLMWLFGSLLEDVSRRCGTDTHRDYLTIARRTEHEGDSFLTITLPAFCRDFERSLEQGQVDSTCFLGFRRHGALPAFLRGLLSQVFDPVCGRLLDTDSPEPYIFAVRQICLLAKKVSVPCSVTRTRRAFDEYVSIDQEVQDHYEAPWAVFRKAPTAPLYCGVANADRRDGQGRPLSERDSADLRFVEETRRVYDRVSSVVWSQVLGNLRIDPADSEFRPRHGPGATAEGVLGNQKYSIKRWHERLEPFFPFAAFGIASQNAYDDGEAHSVDFLEPDAEATCKVISVPKTLSAPRIIAIEPVCMQYTQQALASPIVETIERHPLTAGHINFHDQTVNRKLANAGSKHGRFATIDLSEASDRVHRDLVYRMLSVVPDLRDAVFACRTTRASLADGRTIHLNKFASMGSALCFPIESMVFFTLCVQARLRANNLSPSLKNIKLMASEIYVYGDDIIVPANEVPVVRFYFKLFGLKVNDRKTFWKGKFRESCGLDAYDGVDVTPVYVRCMPPTDKRDASGIVSFVSLANHLYRKGWWVTARRVRAFVESLVGPMPHVLETSPVLGWVSFKTAYSIQGWNYDLHTPVVKGYAVKATQRADPLNGWPALLKYFLKRGEEPRYGRHLSQSVRPGAVSIKLRWASPY